MQSQDEEQCKRSATADEPGSLQSWIQWKARHERWKMRVIACGGQCADCVKLQQRIALVRGAPARFGRTLGEICTDVELETAAKALEAREFKAGEVIMNQGEQGNECFFVEAGECYASIRTGKDGIDTWKEVKQYGAGDFFGDRALLRSELRAATITCRTDVKTLRLSAESFLQIWSLRNHKENLLRRANLFETMGDEQIAKLAGALQRQEYSDKEAIVTQGETGQHFYILDVGECVATIKNGGQDQEVMRYQPGKLFGEKALLENAPRSATITAVGDVCVWALSRADFERKLGPLSQLKAEQYVADPRKLIADFYQRGDARGPAGTLAASGLSADDSLGQTSWFAVYRPCSRDSIAKMLGRVGVGKGLNVKGKSSKRLSVHVASTHVSLHISVPMSTRMHSPCSIQESPLWVRTLSPDQRQ